jgi:hypothetical protein
MTLLIGLLPVLGCGGGMVLCVWLMSRGHRGSTTSGQPDGEVAQLREEVGRLRAELNEREAQPRG